MMKHSVEVKEGGEAKSPSSSTFPTYGIMPKAETQALDFLKNYPSYDGRGTVVAILDTGVDPGAIGLKTTSDGKPKIIDVVDTTGSGDVDTSKVVEGKEEENWVSIKGLTGKDLKLSKEWSNPTGKWHVGAKAEFDLYPKNIIRRIKKDKAKKFLQTQTEREAALLRQISALESADEGGKEAKAETTQDLKDQLAALRTLVGEYNYPGRVFDVVVFHDGTRHLCVVDTSADGDLTTATPMADFKHAQQYAAIDDKDLVNYSLKIYDEGKLLSIVVACGSHGTHVAGITAANFPEDNKNSSTAMMMNGVAPGAQVVSVKIGDTRLGSMETNTGMVRAVSAILENKCDLVNMSYGEPTGSPNQGIFPELCAELVNNHGVIFVSSAGNAGPALSTVGAPGSTTQELIGVGAYVSPAMMETEYSMRDYPVGENQYTWSSRGPATNGHLGVCISAPGGAIAPVPQYTWQKNMLMNGTSMASPNACGGLALLLSALKAEKIPYTPHSVRRGVENSARWVEGIERFAQGHGLLQIKSCFDALSANAKSADVAINYVVKVTSGSGNSPSTNAKQACGIYLREPFEVSQPTEANVSIKPSFHEDHDAKEKQSYEQKILVKSTAFWVETPKYVLMHQGGRSFSVLVDPTALSPGSHYAEIQGLDATDLGKGPLFRVSVTVVVPERKQDKTGRKYEFSDIAFKPGSMIRRYLAVPEGAAYAHIQVKPSSIDTSRRFMLAALWLSPQEGYRDHEINKFMTMKEGSVSHYSMPVRPHTTLEVVLAQYWSSLGVCKGALSVTFHGLSVSPSPIRLALDDPTSTRIDVRCEMGDAMLEVSGKLTHKEAYLRPSSAKIAPLPPTSRDALPKGRHAMQIVLSYVLEVGAKVSKAKIGFPALNGKLYDSPFGSQLYMVFDEHKRCIATGDAWPDPVSLDKGKYTVRLHVRHHKASVLEGLKTLVMVFKTPLPKAIAVTAYSTYTNAALKASKFTRKRLYSKQSTCLYLSAGSVPSGTPPGSVLVGSIKVGKDEDGAKDVVEHHIMAVVPPKPPAAPKAKAQGGGADAKKKKTTPKTAAAAGGAKEGGGSDEKGKEDEKAADSGFQDEIAKAVRGAKIAYISKLKDEKLRKALESDVAKELASSSANNDEKRAVYEMQVKAYKSLKEHDKVIEACELVLGCIDATKVAAFYGVKHPVGSAQDEDEKKASKEMEKDKKALVFAYMSKASALMELAKAELNKVKEEAEKTGNRKDAGLSQEWNDRFKKALDDVLKWADEKKDKKALAPLQMFSLLAKGHNGKALKQLLASLKASPRDKDLMAQRTKLLSYLGWDDWNKELFSHWKLVQFPAGFKCF